MRKGFTTGSCAAAASKAAAWMLLGGSRKEQIEIIDQNFGFDLNKQITEVMLDPAVEYYYMKIRRKWTNIWRCLWICRFWFTAIP